MNKIKTLLRYTFGEKNIVRVKLTINSILRVIGSISASPDIELNCRVFSSPNSHIFFGYYDVSPFSSDEKKLLAMRVRHLGEAGEVGYFMFSDDQAQFNVLGETTTWCWQQGSRLQWFNENEILYNNIQSEKYVTFVQDLSSKKILFSLPFPTYARFGNTILSLNFSRLERLRPGYGYSLIPDDSKKDFCSRADGVFVGDLISKKIELRYSLAEIAMIAPRANMQSAEHYVNHLVFSPSGQQFAFMHLWKSASKRYNRLFVAPTNGGTPKLVDDVEHFSHFCWRNEAEIMAYYFGREGKGYYRFNLQNDKAMRIDHPLLGEDGHPSFFPDGNRFASDTYPDKLRRQHLLLGQLSELDVKDLGSVPSPLSFFGEERCDLHPRISPSSRRICIDSPKSGYRQLWVLDLFEN